MIVNFTAIARATGLLAAFCLLGGVLSATALADTITFRNLDEFSHFFERNGYSLQKWRAGEQPIPPYVILDIPKEWRSEVAPELPVAEKKHLFLRMTVPLAFVANHALEHDRAYLLSLENDVKEGRRLRDADRKWLMEEAARYGVSGTPESAAFWQDLAERMDIVPPSLVIAQMVEESGWGTSRFATDGNALFGQWSYKSGIRPEEQRVKEKGDYRIAAFDTPLDSVHAYLLNLNSNHAYGEFRRKRAELRAAEKVPTGPDLVHTLVNYSERKEEYVHLLQDIIGRNDLAPFDHARLADERIKYLALR